MSFRQYEFVLKVEQEVPLGCQTVKDGMHSQLQYLASYGRIGSISKPKRKWIDRRLLQCRWSINLFRENLFECRTLGIMR